MTARRRSRTFGTTMLAMVVWVAALGAWCRAAAHLAPASGIEAVEGEAMLWLGPGVGPVGSGGDLADADVVVVGDSRVGHGVHLSIAGALGIGSVATVWGSGSRLEDSLRALDGRAPAGLVVALSPLGLVGHQEGATPELLRERHPAFDATSAPHAVDTWAQRAVTDLVASGTPLPAARTAVAWWVRNQRLARAKLLRQAKLVDTEGLDLRLGHRSDRWRALHVPTLEPSEWPHAWSTPAWAAGSDEAYRKILTPERAGERAAAAARVTAATQRLRDAGWRVACVRLPIEPSLRALEDSSGTGALLEAIARDLAAPYLDLGEWPGATTDGSHLDWRGADRATRALAQWLREELRWPAP